MTPTSQLPRRLVRSPNEYAQQVNKDHHDKGVASPIVQTMNQPAEGHLITQVRNALVCVIDGGNVVKQLPDSRHHLDNENKQSRGAESVPETVSAGDFLFQRPLDNRPERPAIGKPINESGHY
jgi:hypothetical protein